MSYLLVLNIYLYMFVIIGLILSSEFMVLYQKNKADINIISLLKYEINKFFFSLISVEKSLKWVKEFSLSSLTFLVSFLGLFYFMEKYGFIELLDIFNKVHFEDFLTIWLLGIFLLTSSHLVKTKFGFHYYFEKIFSLLTFILAIIMADKKFYESSFFYESYSLGLKLSILLLLFFFTRSVVLNFSKIDSNNLLSKKFFRISLSLSRFAVCLVFGHIAVNLFEFNKTRLELFLISYLLYIVLLVESSFWQNLDHKEHFKLFHKLKKSLSLGGLLYLCLISFL